MEKIGILSRHIIIPDFSVPVYGIIVIQGEAIQDFIQLEPSFPPDQVLSKFSQWKIIDYLEHYISPGIIDLNVRREWDSYESLTKAAISGGTTFILEEPSFYKEGEEETAELYCDIGKIHIVNDRSLDSIPDDALAVKAYVFQPCAKIEPLSNVRKCAELAQAKNTPLFLDPNLPDPRMLYMASPLRLENSDDRIEKEVNPANVYAAAFANGTESGSENEEESKEEETVYTSTSSLDPEAAESIKNIWKQMGHRKAIKRNTLLDVATVSREDSLAGDEGLKLIKDHRRGSTKTIFDNLNQKVSENSKNIEVLCQAEKSTYMFSGSTHFSTDKPSQTGNNRRRPPNLNIASEAKAKVMPDYTFYLANCPESWETEGVEYILSKIPESAQVHFQGVSSASAINKIRQKSEGNKNLTCEIPATHLFFNNSNIEPHDTRFKSSPPIRNTSNFNLLLDLLKMRGISSISSQHIFIEKSHKAIESGSFQNALNGICSLGYSMQAVWTTINIPMLKAETLEHYLVRFSKWFSLIPAKILNLKNRGSISKGKLADFIVWSPYSRIVAKGAYGENLIYDNKELLGEIHQVYLRGKMAYDRGNFVKFGQRISRVNK